MWTKFRHKVFHFLFRWLVNLIFRIKNNFRAKRYDLPKGPHLILFNHPSNFDPVYVGCSFNRPTYFIATDDLFNIPFVSKLINYLVAPIPTKKGTNDSTAIRAALKVIKEGGNVGLAPEGNRNYGGSLNTIDKSIVKFVKLLKVPVVIYTIKGGYGHNPRFSVTTRKGKVFGGVDKIISKEEVLSLSNDELYNSIISSLDVDDTTLGLEYKGHNLAESIESAIYVCPVCSKLNTTYSTGNNFGCNSCNFVATYQSNLLFKSDDERFNFNTMKEVYKFQDEFIKNIDFEKLNYEDSNVGISLMSRKKRRDDLLNGNLVMNKDFIYITNSNSTIYYHLDEITSLSLIYHNTLVINVNDQSYYLNSNNQFNALKYLHLFNLVKNKRTGDSNDFLGI